MDYNENTVEDRRITANELINEFTIWYPRVGQRLKALYGYPEFYEYLNEIMIMDEHGSQGFDPESFKILWKLSQL
jgi:hypothetical protein